MGAVNRWLYTPAPLSRVAVLRVIVYAFVVVDVCVITFWPRMRTGVPTELYQPLQVARWLPVFPEPTTPVVVATMAGLLVLAPLAAIGRAPRLLGWTVFALYFEWMLVAMSYGKVDHDHFGFLVALAVLPSVGRARLDDDTASARAGWALRMITLAAIATYFLASWAKLRFGGLEWLTGNTYTWAVMRRGTDLVSWTLDHRWLLVGAQVATIVFELLSPVVFFVTERWRRRMVVFFLGFHVVVFASLLISFAPHVVTLLAFLPLERLRSVRWLSDRGVAGSRPEPGQLDEWTEYPGHRG